MKRLLMVAGLLASFFLFSFMIRETSAIWYQTRIIGLLAYAALCITLVIGELRMLSIDKSQSRLFSWHRPIAVAAIALTFVHLACVILDNFKWGKDLAFVQYLGFSFGDKWLVFLSLGTLSFYLLVLVGISSSRKGMKLFAGWWRQLHLFSYAAFFMAYIHSVNLGTDLRHSEARIVLMPLFIGSFLLVVSLLLTRLVRQYLTDRTEVALTAGFFILLLLGGVGYSVMIVKQTDAKENSQIEIEHSMQIINTEGSRIENLSVENNNIRKQMEVLDNG
jgi:DMSO/TMAO reductase YedYZ heme-binding membrane subunit